MKISPSASLSSVVETPEYSPVTTTCINCLCSSCHRSSTSEQSDHCPVYAMKINYYFTSDITDTCTSITIFVFVSLSSNYIYTCEKLWAKLLIPWIIADVSGQILVGHCNCMAGMGESCSHVASLLWACVRMRDSMTVTQKKFTGFYLLQWKPYHMLHWATLIPPRHPISKRGGVWLARLASLNELMSYTIYMSIKCHHTIRVITLILLFSITVKTTVELL